MTPTTYGSRPRPASRYLGEFMQLVQVLANHEGSVLIRGEYGVGRTHLARTALSRSSVARKRFVFIDCGRCTELIRQGDDERLFHWINNGHPPFDLLKRLMRGNAIRITEERGGPDPEGNEWTTYYFHEVTRLSRSLQTLVLHLNVRLARTRCDDALRREQIIASTSEPLEARVRDGSFHNQLFYDLSRFQVHIPPLRDRRDDIAILAHGFLQEFRGPAGRPNLKGFTPAAIEALSNYSWPGNIRELRAVVKRAVSLAAPEAELLEFDQFLSLIQRQLQLLDIKNGLPETGS